MIHNFYSQLWIKFFEHKFISQLLLFSLFTLFSQLLLIHFIHNFVHNFCLQLMFTNFAHILLTFVHKFCSQLIFATFVCNCFTNLVKSRAQNFCLTFFFVTLVHNDNFGSQLPLYFVDISGFITQLTFKICVLQFVKSCLCNYCFQLSTSNAQLS